MVRFVGTGPGLPDCTAVQGEDHTVIAAGKTVAAFLGAGHLGQLTEKLIQGGYSADCPAAIIDRSTHQEEQVFHTTLAQLVATARQQRVPSTALVLVGEFSGSCYHRFLPGRLH